VTSSPWLVPVVALRRSGGSSSEHRRGRLEELQVVASRVPAGTEVDLEVVLHAIAGGVEVVGTVRAPWVGSCRRCLRDVGGELCVEVRELYRPREQRDLPHAGRGADPEGRGVVGPGSRDPFAGSPAGRPALGGPPRARRPPVRPGPPAPPWSAGRGGAGTDEHVSRRRPPVGRVPTGRAGSAGVAAAELDEEDTYPLDPEHLDLEPLARDCLLLALPLAPLCREDCPGLCPDCGADLAEEPCRCRVGPRDPRWAALDLLDGEPGRPAPGDQPGG